MRKIFFLLLSFTIVSHAQWVQMNGIVNVSANSFAYSGNNIFAGAGNYGASSYGVFLSTNNGSNWSQTSLNNRHVYSLAINGNYIFAGTLDPGVYVSTNNGMSWNQTALNFGFVPSMIVNGNSVYAGTNTGVYKSTNNGSTWSQIGLSNRVVWALLANGNNIYAGTDQGIFRSTNNGVAWLTSNITSQTIRSLTINGSSIFAGDGNGLGVYLSTNNGASWTQTSLNNRIVWALTSNGNNVYAGTGSLYGVYVSTNNGTTWIQRNEGFGNFSVISLFIFNNYIYASPFGNGVWRRPLGELTVIQPIDNEIPNKFSLMQNYPNPFNPFTKIKFCISNKSFTKLTIYDALGEEIMTLVNQHLKPGNYEVEWNAVDVPSGIYYYMLIANDFMETKKAVLIK